MRFGKDRKPPPYLNRRDQLRMLGMLAALTVVMIGIKFASKPSSWYWLTGRPGNGSERQDSTSNERDIDFRVQLHDEKPLPPGVFRARVAADAESHTSAPVDGDKLASLGDSDTEAGLRVEIDPELFSGVRDSTLGIRRAEKDAHDYSLAKARAVPLSYLERASRQDVGFEVLMTDSEQFRGQLITVEGEAHRILAFAAAENDYGIRQLYEAWLLTADSGDNLYRFVCTSLPAGMPQGEHFAEPLRVRVTGYFFKRFGYAAKRGLRTAPLLLGKRMHWFPPRASADTAELGLTPYVLGFVIFVGTVLAFTLWRFRVSDRAFEQSHLKRLTAAPQEALAALQGVETTDLGQFFRDLSDEPDAVDKSATPPQE